MPNTLRIIGDNNFQNYSLKSIYLPSSVEYIGKAVFSRIKQLETIEVDENNTHYTSGDNQNVIYDINNKIVVRGCKNSIIPEDALVIEENCFHGCEGLETITLPNTIERIGKDGFGYCTNLREIRLSESLQVIDDWAFEGAGCLTELIIPRSVNSISEGFATGCTGLKRLKVEEGNSVYDSRDDCNAIIRTADNTLILGCDNTVIPNTIECIGYRAFLRVKNQRSVIIPNSVTRIENEAFYWCTNLTDVTLPENLKYIGQEAFAGCAFRNITLPSCLEYLGHIVFGDCSNLESLYIPKKVVHLGDYSDNILESCSSLANIVVDPQNRWFDSRNGCNAIIESESSTLRSGCKNTHIPEGVTIIASRAFIGCEGLEKINIPSSVESIGYMAFYNCPALTDIYCYLKDPIDIGGSYLDDQPVKRILHVVKGRASIFEAAERWKNFTIVEDLVDLTPRAITIGASGYATYCSDVNLDFSEVEGLKAYIASGFTPNTGVLTITRMDNVPAGEGILLKGTAGESYSVPVTDDVTVVANLMKGTTENLILNSTNDEKTNFVFSKNNEGVVGFYRFVGSVSVPANKAWLQIPTSVLDAEVCARGFRLVEHDDKLTGITVVNANTSKDSVVYDLRGCRLDGMSQHGIYIINGKKVVK